MANWNQLKNFIHTNYKATDISPRALELLFDLGNGRTQLIWVSRGEAHDGAEWAQLDSGVGQINSVDLTQALYLVEDLLCGGLAHLNVRGVDLVTLRHCVPLAELDIDEFEIPLHVVVAAADMLERKLTGRDNL